MLQFDSPPRNASSNVLQPARAREFLQRLLISAVFCACALVAARSQAVGATPANLHADSSVMCGTKPMVGTANPEPLLIVAAAIADSAKGVDPQCDPAAQPDAELSSALPADKLKAVFQQ